MENLCRGLVKGNCWAGKFPEWEIYGAQRCLCLRQLHAKFALHKEDGMPENLEEFMALWLYGFMAVAVYTKNATKLCCFSEKLLTENEAQGV